MVSVSSCPWTRHGPSRTRPSLRRPCTTMSLFAYFGTPESRSFQFLWTAGHQPLFRLAFRLFNASHIFQTRVAGRGSGGTRDNPPRLQDTKDDSSWRAPAPSPGYSSNPRQRVHLGGRAEVLIKPQHPTVVQGLNVWMVNRLSGPKASGPGLPPRLASPE